MPRKKAKTKRATSTSTYGSPKYPYTPKPSSLGKFLSMIPNKPKPEKINPPTLRAWGFKDTNDQSIIRVLRAISLIGSSGEPTKNYEEFMQQMKGPGILGIQLKNVYQTLFSTVANPGSANNEELKNFFNTYGGGSEKVIQLQIQTFKAMAKHATFGTSDPLEQTHTGGGESLIHDCNKQHSEIPIRIDLHIHLPENKTKADYDSILESIAKHLYGKIYE